MCRLSRSYAIPSVQTPPRRRWIKSRVGGMASRRRRNWSRHAGKRLGTARTGFGVARTTLGSPERLSGSPEQVSESPERARGRRNDARRGVNAARVRANEQWEAVSFRYRFCETVLASCKRCRSHCLLRENLPDVIDDLCIRSRSWSARFSAYLVIAVLLQVGELLAGAPGILPGQPYPNRRCTSLSRPTTTRHPRSSLVRLCCARFRRQDRAARGMPSYPLQ